MAERRTLVVAPEDGGERLDRYLTARCDDLSRARVQALIAAGEVLVGGATARSSHKTTPGETISLTLPDAAPSLVTPEAIPLRIVYEDADLLVIDKPAGMVVHP